FLRIDSKLIDGGTIGILTLAIAIQAWAMRPYSGLAAHQVFPAEKKHDVSVLIANVLMSNREADRLLERIRATNPDIVLAVETDLWWVEQLKKIGDDYPHAVEVPLDNTYGMILRSRLPLIEPSVEYLVRPNIP